MRYWIGVASRDHVLKGVEGGFCQLGHGKMSAVRRLSPGDWIIYYSPRAQMGRGDVVQSFTAIGQVRPGAPYDFDMGNGFIPARRDVNFIASRDAPVLSLIDKLGFIKNKKNWGYAFRFGILSIPVDDFLIIANAMQATEAIATLNRAE